MDGFIITEKAYLGTVGIFFGLAILSAILRTSIRIYKHRGTYADDYVFLLAILALIIGTGISFAAVPKIYDYESPAGDDSLRYPDLLQDATRILSYGSVVNRLAWVTIFSVKFSYIFYFRNLLARVRVSKLRVWWWITMLSCVLVTIPFIFEYLFVCPKLASESLLKCMIRPDFAQKELILIYYSVTADILTDAMLISIPIWLLRQTQFSLRKKLYLGSVLCLPVFMTPIGMIRGISTHTYGISAAAWILFWVQIEACLSVMMFSATVLVTVYVAPKTSNRHRDVNAPRSRNGRMDAWKRLPLLDPPSMPNETPTTVKRSIIRENGQTVIGSFGTDDVIIPLRDDVMLHKDERQGNNLINDCFLPRRIEC